MFSGSGAASAARVLMAPEASVQQLGFIRFGPDRCGPAF